MRDLTRPGKLAEIGFFLIVRERQVSENPEKEISRPSRMAHAEASIGSIRG
jgi:hypothetical protein